MKLVDIISMTMHLPYFDLATIAQLSGEPRHSLRMQLSRLVKQGNLVSLRRGMYTLGNPYRKLDPNPALLANRIYTPSYLSFHWALAYYDLIPEAVYMYTSATTRVPRLFQNDFGSFRYRHVKPDCFTGYQTMEIDRQKVLIATPEKALLDLWHIEDGEWTTERMAGMRFQNFEAVSPEKLAKYSALFNSPRLARAVRNWKAYAKAETEGTKEL
jgi:predicted transcriptional regulator of viral defense system